MALSELLKNQTSMTKEEIAADDYFNDPHGHPTASVAASGSFLLGDTGEEQLIKIQGEIFNKLSAIGGFIETSQKILSNIFDSIENTNVILLELLGLEKKEVKFAEKEEDEDLQELEQRLEAKRQAGLAPNEGRIIKKEGGGEGGILATVMAVASLLGISLPAWGPVVVSAALAAVAVVLLDVLLKDLGIDGGLISSIKFWATGGLGDKWKESGAGDTWWGKEYEDRLNRGHWLERKWHKHMHQSWEDQQDADQATRDQDHKDLMERLKIENSPVRKRLKAALAKQAARHKADYNKRFPPPGAIPLPERPVGEPHQFDEAFPPGLYDIFKMRGDIEYHTFKKPEWIRNLSIDTLLRSHKAMVEQLKKTPKNRSKIDKAVDDASKAFRGKHGNTGDSGASGPRASADIIPRVAGVAAESIAKGETSGTTNNFNVVGNHINNASNSDTSNKQQAESPFPFIASATNGHNTIRRMEEMVTSPVDIHMA